MEKLNPDSMQCIKCGFVVFGGVELDEQVCLCGKGKGAWVCNYSKVSVPRYEFEELQRKFEGLKKESSVIKNNKCPSCLRGDEPDIIDEDGTVEELFGRSLPASVAVSKNF
jgi:hypothetical protein